MGKVMDIMDMESWDIPRNTYITRNKIMMSSVGMLA